VASTGSAVRLRAGQLVQIVLTGPQSGSGEQTDYAVMPTGSTVLAAVPGTAGEFVAKAPGAAKVDVTQRPVCVAGQACVAHILVLGDVTVTVVG
jgi:hypothetical protein